MQAMPRNAPDFTLPAAGGGQIALSAQRPQPTVIFFYPKDDTQACTVEAQEFTANAAEFAAAGAVVLGISKDSIAKHEKFIAKYDLAVRLLSDTDGAVCEAYGVWVEKSMYGRNFMGIERATFLVDGRGRIVREWRKVKARGHADQVLAALKAL